VKKVRKASVAAERVKGLGLRTVDAALRSEINGALLAGGQVDK
jgi:hypothetical protein